MRFYAARYSLRNRSSWSTVPVTWASEGQNRSRDSCLMHIEPNILGVIHEGAPCCAWPVPATNASRKHYAPFRFRAQERRTYEDCHIILEGHAINPGDLSWDAIRGLGSLEVFDRTPENAIVPRAREAEAVLTTGAPLSAQTLARLARLRYVGAIFTGLTRSI